MGKISAIARTTGSILYISYRYKAIISRYDVEAGTFLDAFDFSTDSDTDAVVALELSDTTGRIFALIPAASQYDGRVAILDKTTGITLLPPAVDFDYANFMALTPDGSTLFLGVKGLSPSTFRRYSTTSDIIVQTHSLDAGGNGQSLIVSPDGQHVSFLCGGGNTGLATTYSIADYATMDLSVNGAWNLGPYPSHGMFSADSTAFYAIRRLSGGFSGEICIFSTNNYSLMATKSVPLVDSDTVLEASADGSAIVVFTQAYDGTNNRIWFVNLGDWTRSPHRPSPWWLSPLACALTPKCSRAANWCWDARASLKQPIWNSSAIHRDLTSRIIQPATS